MELSILLVVTIMASLTFVGSESPDTGTRRVLKDLQGSDGNTESEISVSSNGNYRNILQLLMDTSFDNVDSEPNVKQAIQALLLDPATGDGSGNIIGDNNTQNQNKIGPKPGHNGIRADYPDDDNNGGPGSIFGSGNSRQDINVKGEYRDQEVATGTGSGRVEGSNNTQSAITIGATGHYKNLLKSLLMDYQFGKGSGNIIGDNNKQDSNKVHLPAHHGSHTGSVSDQEVATGTGSGRVEGSNNTQSAITIGATGHYKDLINSLLRDAEVVGTGAGSIKGSSVNQSSHYGEYRDILSQLVMDENGLPNILNGKEVSGTDPWGFSELSMDHQVGTGSGQIEGANNTQAAVTIGAGGHYKNILETHLRDLKKDRSKDKTGHGSGNIIGNDNIQKGNAVGTGQRYNKELLMDGLPDNGAGSITGGDNMRRQINVSGDFEKREVLLDSELSGSDESGAIDGEYRLKDIVMDPYPDPDLESGKIISDDNSHLDHEAVVTHHVMFELMQALLQKLVTLMGS